MAELLPSLTHLAPPLRMLQIRMDRFSPNFDLWSTGGVITKTTDPTTLDNDRKRWVKNW